MKKMAALVTSALAALVAGGCWHGSDSDEPERAVADTRFGAALASVGGASAPIGTGYGWIDVSALREGRGSARALDAAASALGPTGSRLLRDRDALRRRTGLDLASADALLATATSYTTALRADGIDPGPFLRRVRAADPAVRRRAEWSLFDFGRVSSIRFGTPVEALEQLGPRIAVSDDAVVGATRDQTREALLGAGRSPLDDPVAALAVACIGDAVAARIVPNNFTHWPGHGPDLFAMGVGDDGRAEGREVLCVADDDRNRAADAAAAMEGALAPDAEDAVTGERMSDLLSRADVDLVEADDAFAARAEIVPAPGRRPGFVMAAFVRGSAVTYIGQPPLRVGTPGR